MSNYLVLRIRNNHMARLSTTSGDAAPVDSFNDEDQEDDLSSSVSSLPDLTDSFAPTGDVDTSKRRLLFGREQH